MGSLVVASVSGLGSAVGAQTPDSQPVPLSLEQIMQVEIPSVVGASRFAQQVVDAPATVTIVTSDEIERFGYRTLSDLLRGVRGFYVTYDRNYSYVGSRGFLRPGDYDSRILLLLDGHRLNDNIYDQGPVGTDFPLDLHLIDRVEIVRGPSSSLYGTSAFFAVINVVTRKGSTAQSEAGFTAGSQATLEGGAVFARRFSRAGELQLSATQYSSDGLKRVPVDASGLTTFDMDRDRATRLFGAYSKGKWTAEGIFSTRTKGIPTGAYDVSLTDRASETADERGFLGLRYEGAVRGTSVLWNGAYDWYNYDGVYSDRATEDHLKDFAYGKWWSSEVTASRRLQKHLVTTGAEVRDNVQQDQGVYYGEPGDDRDWVVNDKRTSSQWALFGQDEFKPTRWAIVSAGVQYDHWPTFGGTTNPRVGFILKPRPNTSFKVMHGTAFRAPNLYELYCSGDFTEVLKPSGSGRQRLRGRIPRWPDACHLFRVPLPHSRSDLAGRGGGSLRGYRLRQCGCHRCVGRRSRSRAQLGTRPAARQLHVHLDQERRRRRAIEQLAAASGGRPIHDAVAASSRDARHGMGLHELAPDDHGRRDLRLRTGQSDAYLR